MSNLYIALSQDASSSAATTRHYPSQDVGHSQRIPPIRLTKVANPPYFLSNRQVNCLRGCTNRLKKDSGVLAVCINIAGGLPTCNCIRNVSPIERETGAHVHYTGLQHWQRQYGGRCMSSVLGCGGCGTSLRVSASTPLRQLTA
jgi:hypothetical protein